MDVIPPFEFYSDGEKIVFPGQNWTPEGQEFLQNDCELPVVVPPNPVVNVTVDQCHGPGGVVPTKVLVTVGSLVVDNMYGLRVTGPEEFTDTTLFLASADSMQFTVTIGGPGDYLAEVGSEGEVPLYAQQAFTVNAKCEVPVPPAPKPPAPATPKPPVLVDAGISSAGVSNTTGAGVGIAGLILVISGSTLLLLRGAKRFTSQ